MQTNMESAGSFCVEEKYTPPCTGAADIRLGDNILSAHFVKELEHFYKKADKRDQSKCLELITSMNHCEDLKKHLKKLHYLKSAMPDIVTDDDIHNSTLDPYQTSYKRDYPYKTAGHVWAVRPMTSVGYVTSKPQSQPLGPTVYDVEYCRKLQRPASPERSATASGQRCNKPHPPQSFLVWKFPSKSRSKQVPGDKQLQELTDEKLRQITKRLCHSVYQNDYLGIPQGFQVKSAFNLPTNWKDNVPYGKNSTQRENYQPPQQLQELTAATTRYGSNVNKQVPAIAAIPTANKRMIGVNAKTTYDSHFNDNVGSVTEQIRDASRKQEAETLRNICDFKEGQSQIGKLMKEFEASESSASRNTPRVAEAQPFTQHSHRSTPVDKGYRSSSLAASLIAQRTHSARSYQSIPPATNTKSPHEAPTPMTPIFTPPLFLS